MSNSVEIHSIKATLVRLSYGTDAEVNNQLQRRIHTIVGKYVVDSEGRQLSQFLVQPVLTAIVDYPQRPAPFSVLLCLLVEFRQWKTADPALRAAATALKTLVGLFSQERLPSLSNKVYSTLQACISLLEGRLKPPAVDGVTSACFIAMESKDWAHKVGALEVLATLVQCCATCKTLNNEKGTNNRTLLTDFLDLAAITAQRQAQFDPSKRVREAANSLLSTIECPVGTTTTTTVDSKEKKSVSAESVEPFVINCTTKSANNSDDTVVEQESPIPLALTPLPAFSKELSEDELCGWRREKENAAAASPSIGSVPNTIHHSPDAFSMLGSDIHSINSAIEMDIENFLRGSILPAATAAAAVDFHIVQQQQHLDAEEDDDIYSEGWDDLLNPSFLSYKSNEERGIEATCDSSALINLVLDKALAEHFKNIHGNSSMDFNLTTEDIEEILRTCLDLHSEQAYEHHLQRAEALLVRTSQQLQGKPNADTELKRKVQALEKDVHRAVAEQQARFMESVVPEIADILANPQMLERLLMAK
jgi:hypothetical protein